MEAKQNSLAWYEKTDVPLRALAMAATLSAAVVMVTNKQTKVITATVSNFTVTLPITAKYKDTPSFVFFVVMNFIGCGYCLVTLLTSLTANKIYKSTRAHPLKFATYALDLATVVGVTAAAAAATAISELGKNGNSHTQWNKVCDKFGRFCGHGGGALIASFVGVVALMLLVLKSIYTLHRSQPHHIASSAPASV